MKREDLQNIIDNINCEPYWIRIIDPYNDMYGGGWNIQVVLTRKDVVSGKIGVGAGGKYYVSPHSTTSEVVQKCLGAVIAYAEHEIRETFTWKGKPIFHPHYDIEALWSICDRIETRD